jgi:hypothetical protein
MDYPGNGYPNPDNYPEPSFPQALTPPAEDPDDPDLETLIVEYNPAWTKVLMAACDQLLLYSSWEGDHDAKILAVNRASNLKWVLQNPADLGEETVPTPYWDSETDVDDEQPIDEQDWYGYVEDALAPADEITFVQSAVIWILTGFVALVLSPTLPVGAAAAVTFRTLATRFTLAFNRGDIGEQFRVIVDAADYETVDTADMDVGDIVEIDINGLPDAAYHDIVIVRTVSP